MKKTCFLVVLFYHLSTISYAQQIMFFNVGIQDIPQNNLVITTQAIQEKEEYFVKWVKVNAEQYSLIKQFVIHNNTHNIPTPGTYFVDEDVCAGNYAYGSYAVQICNDTDSLIYFMDSSEKSGIYFENLSDLLKSKGHTDLSLKFRTLITSGSVDEYYEGWRPVEKAPVQKNHFIWILGSTLFCLFIITILFIIKHRKKK